MRFTAMAMLKDLRRRRADPASLLLWIGIPLAIGGLMNLVVGSAGTTPPRARVLLADLDQTFASRLLAGAGGGRGAGEILDIQPVGYEEGRRRIDAGDATALLVIPAGFQRAVLEDTPIALRLITNPAERILPSIVREALEILVDVVFYAQRLIGPELRQVGGSQPGAPTDAQVAAASVAVRAKIRALEGTLLPPALSLAVKAESPRPAGALDFGQLFLPGILFMSFLFIAQGVSLDVWEERTRGTLRRALVTPQGAHAWLAGKLAAGAAVVSLVALVALSAATSLFGVPWSRVPAAALWCVFGGGVLLALMTFVQTLAGSERGANLLSTILVFPLMMLGGSFFPFESMPAWMAAAGRWTPNGAGVARLKEMLFGTPDPASVLIAALAMGAPAALAFLAATRRLRGRFATG